MNSIQDVIEKKISIQATQEQVYVAISDPNQIIKWFPDAIEGSLEAGQRPILDFGKYGKNQIYVVDAKPFSYFAYRWLPGSDHFIGDVLTVTNTLVEFFINPQNDGTVEVIL